MVKKKRKLKKIYRVILGILLTIFILFLLVFLGYKYLESSIMKLGYSKESSKFILENWKYQYVQDYPSNKTLNAAFESKYYKEKNIEHYTKITYYKQDNFIKNINTLLEKGYSDREISMIFAHGDSNSVTEFGKRDYIEYLDEFLSYDFAKLENYDRYINYMNEYGDDEETTIIKVNLDLDKENYTDYKTVTKYDKTMLVNKHYYLGEEYAPKDLVKVPNEYLKDKNDEIEGVNEAISSAIIMIKAAQKDGLDLRFNSGYRSFKDQEDVYNTYLNLYGESYVTNYVIKAGFSEHQTGYAFDFASGTSNIFASSEEYKWMIKNSYKYGFIYRFLKSKEEITGVKHEAWHFRYVGKKVAKIIDTEELSLEEYYAKYMDTK